MTLLDAEECTAWFDREFASTRVLVILRGMGVERTLARAREAWDSGVTAIEVPLQSDADAQALAQLAGEASARGLRVGAGTVLSRATVSAAADAGASYVVAPGTDTDVIQASLGAGLPVLPGVASATDVGRCVGAGLRWLKMFPAASLTPAWLSAMRGPFPTARFVATGGIHAGNARAFIDAGARVVATGSAIDQVPAIRAAVEER